MTGPAIRSAMVLAAGLGTRMQPLTGHTPKALLPITGRSLLDHALDRLSEAGIDRVVVNAHCHAEQVADRLRARVARHPGQLDTMLQIETELLETGGAVRQALLDRALPADAPFLVINGDSFWLDGPVPALVRLLAGFDPGRHDALLLMARSATVIGEVGSGDFTIDPAGVLRRPDENEIVPYVFAGVQLLSPRLFDEAPDTPFSMNLVWDQAIVSGRIGALVHDGPWFHLSRPADIADTERALRDSLSAPPDT